MSLGLNITLLQDSQISNFVYSPSKTINADVTRGEFKWSGTLLKRKKNEKNL